MNSISLSQPGWIKKSGVFLLFFVVATMVFAIITFSPWSRRRFYKFLGAGTSGFNPLIF
jgi:hypothetical protein